MLRRLVIIINVILIFSCRANAQYGARDYALVGGKESGDIILGLFKAQQGVGGYHYINGNHWEHSRIDSFCIAIFRDSSLLFSHHNQGNIFDSVLTMKFKDLKVGDRVLIYDIRATWPEISRLFLSPLEYIMR